MILIQIISEKVEIFRHKLHVLRIKNPAIFETVKFLVFSLIIIILVSNGIQGLKYRWQWYRIPDYLIVLDKSGIKPGPLLTGLAVTLAISAVSLVLAIIFGFITAIFRLSDSVTANLVSRFYLEIIRNTPLLIQLFLIYFVIAPILGTGRIASAVLALSLFEGAYASEIIRSGIISIDKGQWEAAYSIGLSRRQTYQQIILPQAFRQVLPMLASQAISLVKDSALVSTIAIYELTMQGQVAISKTFLTFEIWFTVAAVYLIVNIVLSVIIQKIEIDLKKVEI